MFLLLILIFPVVIADNKPDYFECYYTDFGLTICTELWYTVKEFIDGGGNAHYIAKGKGYWKFYYGDDLIGEGKINIRRNALTRDDAVTQLIRNSQALIDFNYNYICLNDRIIKYVDGELKFIKDIKEKCNDF